MSRLPLACPMCAQPMRRTLAAPSVEVDCCDAHGVWLDLGELEALGQHLAVRQVPAAPAPVAGFGMAAPAAAAAAPAGPSLLESAGRILVQSAAGGAGFGAGTSVGSIVASSLVRKLFG